MSTNQTIDQAAQLRAAIAEARIVFKDQPVANDVLAYLTAIIDTNKFFASAPVPAQTGIATTGLPADYINLIVTTGRVDASIAKESHTVAGAAPVVLENSAASTAANQAAATMAAESAQLVVDAERSVAARAEPLTLQQVDKVEDCMIASLAKPLTDAQREAMREGLVAGFRALNAMDVQPHPDVSAADSSILANLPRGRFLVEIDSAHLDAVIEFVEMLGE